MDVQFDQAEQSAREKIAARRALLQEIKEDLIDRLQLEHEPQDIDDDTILFGAGLALDSIDAMEIIIGVEAKFGVTVPEGDVSPLRTVSTLADFVAAGQQSPG